MDPLEEGKVTQGEAMVKGILSAMRGAATARMEAGDQAAGVRAATLTFPSANLTIFNWKQGKVDCHTMLLVVGAEAW